MFKVNL